MRAPVPEVVEFVVFDTFIYELVPVFKLPVIFAIPTIFVF